MVKLGDVCKTLSGGTPLKSKENYYNPPQIPWVNSGDLKVRNITKVDKFISEEGLKNSSAKIVPAKTVLVAMYGATAGQVSILDIPASTNQAVCSILPNEKINPIYLYYILSSKTKYLVDMSVGGAQPNISQGIIKNLQIPLPPMSVQEEIVKELDAYQAIIDGAQKVVDNWKPTFKINPQWEKVSFETLYLIPSKNGLTKPTAIRGNGFKMINMGELFENDKIANIPMSLVPLTENEKQNNEVIVGDLLFARQSLVISGAGKNSIVVETDDFTTFESHLIRVRLDNKKALPLFYHYYLNSSDTPIKNIINYANQAGIKGSDLAKLSVLHPSLEEQKAIVAQIEQEEQYVEACKKLIELNKQKISNRIKSIWNCND